MEKFFFMTKNNQVFVKINQNHNKNKNRLEIVHVISLKKNP